MASRLRDTKTLRKIIAGLPAFPKKMNLLSRRLPYRDCQNRNILPPLFESGCVQGNPSVWALKLELDSVLMGVKKTKRKQRGWGTDMLNNNDWFPLFLISLKGRMKKIKRNDHSSMYLLAQIWSSRFKNRWNIYMSKKISDFEEMQREMRWV